MAAVTTMDRTPAAKPRAARASRFICCGYVVDNDAEAGAAASTLAPPAPATMPGDTAAAACYIRVGGGGERKEEDEECADLSDFLSRRRLADFAEHLAHEHGQPLTQDEVRRRWRLLHPKSGPAASKALPASDAAPRSTTAADLASSDSPLATPLATPKEGEIKATAVFPSSSDSAPPTPAGASLVIENVFPLSSPTSAATPAAQPVTPVWLTSDNVTPVHVHQPHTVHWKPRPPSEVQRMWARGDTTVAQENTMNAFRACPKGSTLAPSVMLTLTGDLLLNHDLCPSDLVRVNCPADIRLLSRAEIEQLVIVRDPGTWPPGKPLYPHEARFAFLDQLLDEFFLPAKLGGSKIFLDIKHSLYPLTMIAYPTAQAVVAWLERYRVARLARWEASQKQKVPPPDAALWVELYSVRGFYERIWVNSGNPYVVMACMERMAELSLPTDLCLIDYNDRNYDEPMAHTFAFQIKNYQYEKRYGAKFICTQPKFMDVVTVNPLTLVPTLKTVLYGPGTLVDAANLGADYWLG